MDPRSWTYDAVTVTADGNGIQGYHELTVAGEATYRFSFQQYAARPMGPGDRITRNSAPGLQVACAVDNGDGFEHDAELTVRGGRETVTVYNADLRDVSDETLARAGEAIDAYLADDAPEATRTAVSRFFNDVRNRSLLE